MVENECSIDRLEEKMFVRFFLAGRSLRFLGALIPDPNLFVIGHQFFQHQIIYPLVLSIRWGEKFSLNAQLIDESNRFSKLTK